MERDYKFFSKIIGGDNSPTKIKKRFYDICTTKKGVAFNTTEI